MTIYWRTAGKGRFTYFISVWPDGSVHAAWSGLASKYGETLEWMNQ